MAAGRPAAPARHLRQLPLQLPRRHGQALRDGDELGALIEQHRAARDPEPVEPVVEAAYIEYVVPMSREAFDERQAAAERNREFLDQLLGSWSV